MSAPNSNFSKKTALTLLSIEGYAIVEKIGAGSYSTVYKGVKKTGNREAVAIKCVEKSRLSPSGVDNIISEISMMKMLKHKYIVDMKDFQWDDRFIYIIMEYCDAGDLSNFIRKRKTLPEHICQRFMQQLAVALKFLRSYSICHLDLKPQNLLLVSQPNLVLKVGDFGFAQFLSNETYKYTLRGSPLYMAPEMLLKRHYDAKVDLWSVGVIAYECLFGKAPYSSSSISELQEKIKNQALIEIPENNGVSKECRHLLQRLLKHNPEERIDFEEFFDDPFLDLEHAPSPESDSKAVKLLHEAVRLDINKDYKEAFLIYCEGLNYLVPSVAAEGNAEKKSALKKQVAAYIKRAEELKTVLYLDKPVEQNLDVKPSIPVSIASAPPPKAMSIDSVNTSALTEENGQRKSTLKTRVSSYVKPTEERKTVLCSDKPVQQQSLVARLSVPVPTTNAASSKVSFMDSINTTKPTEENVQRISTLKTRVSSYVKPTEERQMVLYSDTKQSVVVKPSVSASTANTASSEDSSMDSSIKSINLRLICMDAPNILRGIDIGFTAQKYLAEGKYMLALENFEASLGVLLPLLAEEPMGVRKELLYEQTQDWLKQAESTKTLLTYMKTSTAENEPTKGKSKRFH